MIICCRQGIFKDIRRNFGNIYSSPALFSPFVWDGPNYRPVKVRKYILINDIELQSDLIVFAVEGCEDLLFNQEGNFVKVWFLGSAGKRKGELPESLFIDHVIDGLPAAVFYSHGQLAPMIGSM